MARSIYILVITTIFYWNCAFAQSTTIAYDSITIVGTDTLIGPPITFRQYDERFVDLLFFDGNFNVVSFRMMEKNTSFQFMLSSLDSAVYCFQTDPEEFNILMKLVNQISDELAAQSNWPVKCNYCQTMQMFWYDGEHERSTLKRSIAIPQSFNTLLDYCYEISNTEKRKCNLTLNNFLSLEGFDNKLRGPSSNK